MFATGLYDLFLKTLRVSCSVCLWDRSPRPVPFCKRWSPVRTARSRAFYCLRLLFVSCKISLNVNISQLLTWNNFKVSCQPPIRMQSGRSFILRSVSYHLTWWNNFAAVKSIKLLEKKRIWKASKIRYVVMDNIDSYAIKWDLQCL